MGGHTVGCNKFEYPPFVTKKVGDWLHVFIQPYNWSKAGIKVERVFKLIAPTERRYHRWHAVGNNRMRTTNVNDRLVFDSMYSRGRS